MYTFSRVTFATLLTIVAGSMSVATVEAGSRENGCETSQSIFTLFQGDCSGNNKQKIRSNSRKPIGEEVKKPGKKAGKRIARVNFRALTTRELRGQIYGADRNGHTGDNNSGGNVGGATSSSVGGGTSASGFGTGTP